MHTESGILVRMEDGRMPTLKSIVKSLRPTKTLIVVPVGTELAPLPIGIATENYASRVVALVDTSLGKSLSSQFALVEDVQPFDPEWSVMLSHLTLVAKVSESVAVVRAHEFAACRTLPEKSQLGTSARVREAFREGLQLTHFSNHITIIAKRG